jgi:NAD(P)-dependent dehydrogenase (short-subunit alcohol dehydrogenase family)
MSRFHNATAVIVGGSKGIGFRLAEHVLAAGGRVVITARDGNALNRRARRLGGPDRVLAVAGSAVDPAHRQAAVSAALEQSGSLDHLVVNAAAGHLGPIVDMSADELHTVLENNVVAPLEWSRMAYDTPECASMAARSS